MAEYHKCKTHIYSIYSIEYKNNVKYELHYCALRTYNLALKHIEYKKKNNIKLYGKTDEYYIMSLPIREEEDIEHTEFY